MTSKKKIKQLFLVVIIILFFSISVQGETVVPDCGGGGSGGGSSLSGDRLQLDEANVLQWAAGSPPSISANSSGTASVEGGHPPFIWTLSGSDYSFSNNGQDNAETTQSNAIIVYGNNFNNCSAPTANITVIASVEGGQDAASGTISPSTVAFDYDNAPPSVDGDAQITPGSSSATVYVTGGVSPYTWSVSPNSGTDYFTLAASSGSSNTVYLHGNPCLAEITIVDGCGNSATGYVRGPGQWGNRVYDECKVPGTGIVYSIISRRLIRGNYRQTHDLKHITSQYYGDCIIDEPGEVTDCSLLCATYPLCDGEVGCNDCLYKERNNIMPCKVHPLYGGNDCPPRCYHHCRCTSPGGLYYQEWECEP